MRRERWRAMTSLFAISLVAGGCGGPSSALPMYPIENPRLQATSLQLPEFKTGTFASLEQHRGRVVLLDVWASWCEPCRESLPALQSLANTYDEKGLSVLTVSIDTNLEALESFISEVSLALPVWHDPSGKRLSSVFRFSQAPTSYVLDRSGTVRFVHVGAGEAIIKKQRAQIDLLLKETASAH